jgi:hypothetical protein
MGKLDMRKTAVQITEPASYFNAISINAGSSITEDSFLHKYYDWLNNDLKLSGTAYESYASRKINEPLPSICSGKERLLKTVRRM